MTKLKLSDAERVILAAAGARESRLVLPLPKSLRTAQGALHKVIGELTRKDLIQERAAVEDEPVWATSEIEGRKTLIVTDTGLTAVGMAVGATEVLIVAQAVGAKVRPTSKTPKKPGDARCCHPSSRHHREAPGLSSSPRGPEI